MNLSYAGQERLLEALHKAGMTYFSADQIIKDPSLAKAFVKAGTTAIKGKRPLLKTFL